eukprot:TRINITY_DN37008_c0_g1_i1.p1 TRINITY_DN37008_c0_g1~~TRINITY_DN37008_c0_g1_i1.p1  ORF type:complete len:862 (+),score=196.87 TRINITY_DN37008_c0_g1_i1:122-2707(+)
MGSSSESSDSHVSSLSSVDSDVEPEPQRPGSGTKQDGSIDKTANGNAGTDTPNGPTKTKQNGDGSQDGTGSKGESSQSSSSSKDSKSKSNASSHSSDKGSKKPSSKSSGKKSKSGASKKSGASSHHSSRSSSSSSGSLSKGKYTEESFIEAAQAGNKDFVIKALDKGIDVNSIDSNSWGALHHAMWSGHLEVVKVLMERGCDPGVSLPADGMWGALAPIHLGASSGHTECIQVLLDHDSKQSSKVDGKNRTALHIAASAGHVDVVKLLTAVDVDSETGQVTPVPYLNAQDTNGDTALHCAVRARSVAAVTALRDIGADTSIGSSNVVTQDKLQDKKQSPYDLAVALEYEDVAEVLAPTRPASAASSNLSQTAEKRPDAAGVTPAEEGGEESAQPPPTTPGRRKAPVTSPASAFTGRYHAAFPASKNSPLVTAAIANRAEEVTALCRDQGVKADERDAQGWTALHHAAWHGADRAVEALITRGALLTNAVWDGCRPLHLAALGSHAETVRVILDKGGKVNITDGNLGTALHHAMREGSVACGQVLLEHGASTNVSDHQGNTVLHCAVLADSLDCVNLLLQHGASPAARNADEHTPKLVALYGGLPNSEAIMDAMWNAEVPAARSPRSGAPKSNPRERAAQRTANIYLHDGVNVDDGPAQTETEKRVHQPLHRSNKVTPLGPLPGQGGKSPRKATRGHKNHPVVKKSGRKITVPSFQPKVHNSNAYQHSPYHSSNFPSWIDKNIKQAKAQRYLVKPHYVGPTDRALEQGGVKTPRKARKKKRPSDKGHDDDGGDGTAPAENGDGDPDAVRVPAPAPEDGNGDGDGDGKDGDSGANANADQDAKSEGDGGDQTAEDASRNEEEA